MSEFIQMLWDFGPQMIAATPHGQALGIKFIAVDKNTATLALPYNQKLIGNTETGVMHGGAVTTLLDQTAGLAAVAGLDGLAPVATLSLRIDYMRAAEPETTILAQAHCYKTTRNITFLRALAHTGDEDNPVATAQACFMINGPIMDVNQASQAIKAVHKGL